MPNLDEKHKDSSSRMFDVVTSLQEISVRHVKFYGLQSSFKNYLKATNTQL